MVFINLGENDDPYLIFESLNYKGTPLTQADLVRNYLLLRLQTGAQEKIYQQHWLPMQERLRDALPEFVRQYLMQKGEEVAKGDVYSVLKKRTLAVSDALMPAEIERLNAASVHYQYIIDPRTVKNARLQRSLTRLLRWEMATCHPLLLRLYTGHATGDVTNAELIDCLEIIESFGVRRYICGVPTNQLKRIFLSLMGVVQRGQTAANLRANLAKGSLGRRWPKDVEFKAAWLKFRLYSRPVDRCKFILESLEDAHGHREGGDPSAATIEHIMPQTLSPAWREALERTEATHEQWLHRRKPHAERVQQRTIEQRVREEEGYVGRQPFRTEQVGGRPGRLGRRGDRAARGSTMHAGPERMGASAVTSEALHGGEGR
nr:DUF262 domain-containing protein [Deltaproteobacteria bacterium]